MNHIPPQQYLMILVPPLQSVHTSYIICHKKILVLLQQSSLSMNSPLYLSVSQEAESENLYISTRKHSNLVTVPIQNDSNSGSTSGIELSWNYASTAIFYHATSPAINKSSKATSFPGHRPIIAQMPPYMKCLPPGPTSPQQGNPPVSTHPSHHYNAHSLPQFTEDQGTLGTPFI
eukprot:bmy_07946T0